MRSLAYVGLSIVLVAVIAAAGFAALQRHDAAPPTPAPNALPAPPHTTPAMPPPSQPDTPAAEPDATPFPEDAILAPPDMPEVPPVEIPPRRYTLAERLDEIGPAARERVSAKFEAAGVRWPPHEVTLVALKDENVVELHARRRAKPWRLVHRYPVHKASGGPGPKLREGDRQVPEGVYRVIFLNPNSRYHVSLRLDYPNAFDQRMGARDGRTRLGGDIMIHGKALSVGCLAMGDEAAEELFVLAAAVLPQRKQEPRMKVIIAPTDFRTVAPAPPAPPVPPLAPSPAWVPDLYADIAREMARFPRDL